MDHLADRLKTLLKAAGPVDGVYLCLHGAMRSEESVDPDGDLIAMTRSIVGPNIPVVVSLDLHAVMTPRKSRSRRRPLRLQNQPSPRPQSGGQALRPAAHRFCAQEA